MIAVVRDFVRVLRLPCREYTALFSRQLDEPLPRGVASAMQTHTLYCGGCRRFRAQIRRLRGLAHGLGRELDSGEAMPPAARDRLRRRISG